jgi:hypothetical protein
LSKITFFSAYNANSFWLRKTKGEKEIHLGEKQREKFAKKLAMNYYFCDQS